VAVLLLIITVPFDFPARHELIPIPPDTQAVVAITSITSFGFSRRFPSRRARLREKIEVNLLAADDAFKLGNAGKGLHRFAGGGAPGCGEERTDGAKAWRVTLR
jgi:hypothetical protein